MTATDLTSKRRERPRTFPILVLDAHGRYSDPRLRRFFDSVGGGSMANHFQLLVKLRDPREGSAIMARLLRA